MLFNGCLYMFVVMLNGWLLLWWMKNGWKEFYLMVEFVVCEMVFGMNVNLWGYNG